MDPRDYRKQVEDAVARSKGAAVPDAAPAELRALALDRAADAGLRAAALGKLAGTVLADDELLGFAIGAIADEGEPTDVRLAALGVVQLASVTSPSLKTRRPVYLAGLRQAVDTTDDSPEETELRWRILGVLAREHDPAIQDRLLDGLRDPAKAIVPADKAIQLLGYDAKIVSEAGPLLQDIARSHRSEEARVEAVRLLAVDPGARDAIADLLRDRDQPEEVRQAAVAALRAVDPRALRAIARDVVLDDSESGELHTTSVAALGLDDPDDDGDDDELNERIAQLERETSSNAMKQSARTYLARRKR